MPFKPEPKRADSSGRARAGSQRQLQTYVNYRKDEFSQKVLASLDPSAGPDAKLWWKSLPAEDKFNESRDVKFLDKMNLSKHSIELKKFWPKDGP